ncbi:uncharacterized protein BDR25DRAFT_301358, partial [Lindgomyces ingoldianus]
MVAPPPLRLFPCLAPFSLGLDRARKTPSPNEILPCKSLASSARDRRRLISRMDPERGDRSQRTMEVVVCGSVGCSLLALVGGERRERWWFY